MGATGWVDGPPLFSLFVLLREDLLGGTGWDISSSSSGLFLLDLLEVTDWAGDSLYSMLLGDLLGATGWDIPLSVSDLIWLGCLVVSGWVSDVSPSSFLSWLGDCLGGEVGRGGGPPSLPSLVLDFNGDIFGGWGRGGGFFFSSLLLLSSITWVFWITGLSSNLVSFFLRGGGTGGSSLVESSESSVSVLSSSFVVEVFGLDTPTTSIANTI